MWPKLIAAAGRRVAEDTSTADPAAVPCAGSETRPSEEAAKHEFGSGREKHESLRDIALAPFPALPPNNGRAPRQSGAEAGEKKMVPAVDAAGGKGFVQGERNAAGGRVAVAIEVDDHRFW